MNPISSIFSSPVMSITNKTKGLSVLIPMRILKTSLRFQSKAARHMMETGSSVVDQRVLMPIGIEIEMIAPSDDSLLQANEAFLDRSSMFTIQTRGIIIDDMRVDYEGLDQNAKNISSTPMKYSFTQLLYQGQNNAIAAQSGDASMIDRGLSVINRATETVDGVFNKINNITSVF